MRILWKKVLALGAAVLIAGTTLAQGQSPGAGMGPGMIGGQQPAPR
jgi:hypothetical protein